MPIRVVLLQFGLTLLVGNLYYVCDKIDEESRTCPAELKAARC